ncbi:hypothetical protein SDC9_180264 [bioreactor metagenome]|uniref:Uncharacterized protein n=1 Tax=bioreactor metagenome TaxID=1076179 RepID=A0A645H936_9ZZZZ
MVHGRELNQLRDIACGDNGICQDIQGNQRLALAVPAGTFVGKSNRFDTGFFQLNEAGNEVRVRIAVAFFRKDRSICADNIRQLGYCLCGTLFLLQRYVQVGHDHAEEIQRLAMFFVQPRDHRIILVIEGRPLGGTRHEGTVNHGSVQHFVGVYQAGNEVV